MALDIGREFQLGQAIIANDLIRQLVDPTLDWTFEDLRSTLSSLRDALEKACFDQTLASDDGERFLRLQEELYAVGLVEATSGQAIIHNYLEAMRQWNNGLINEFGRELNKMPVCLPKQRLEGINAWFFIEEQFQFDEFRALTLPARRSFQEAGRCFLFEQYTSCAVMSMRAAEAMLRECYYRVRLENPSTKDGWGDLLARLDFNDRDEWLQKVLEHGKEQRNELVHPRLELVKADAGKAQEFFFQSRMIVRGIMQHLRDQGKALAVAIYLGRSNWVSMDILTALWLLNHYRNGIGRLVFVDSEEQTVDNPDYEEYDFLLGKGSDRFDLVQGTSYAGEIAKDLDVEKQHLSLLDYCTSWLTAKREKRLLDETAVYEQTLEGIVEATQAYYQPRDRRPELWIKRVFRVFDQVERLELDPDDPNLLSNLHTNLFDEAINYWRHIRQKETALKNKKDIDYLGLRGLVTLIDAIEFESFANVVFEQGYQLVALTDGIRAFWIKTNVSTTSLSSIARRLRSKVGDMDRLDIQERGEIRQKQPVRLTVDELYNCVQPD